MREIKFRAWDEKTKQMVYNIHTLYDGMIDDSELSGDGIYETDIPTASFGSVLYSKISVTQSTGLKDKNGKDIYEGDIYHQGDKNILYKVIFKDCYFIGNQIGNESLAGLSHFIKDVEVIGNIYENPELLTN